VDREERRLEVVDAFEKKRTLLFKEYREPLINGDHGLISFNLREVWGNRHVKRGGGRDAELCRQTKIEFGGGFTKRPGSTSEGSALSWAGDNAETRLPVSETVMLGINSSVRSVEMPSSPVMWPS